MKVTVYLGSRPGNDGKYRENARELGRQLARRGIEVIYGGASVGTMGALAEGVREEGGHLIGVFPKGFLGRKDHAAKGLEVRNLWTDYPNYELIETETFDERIRTMERLSDACIVLPGSHGTMHEFFSYFEGLEVGRFDKPIFILNTDGYYDPLIAFIRNMVSAGFTGADDLGKITVVSTPAELVERLA